MKIIFILLILINYLFPQLNPMKENNQKGKIFFAQQDYKMAIEYFRKALQKAPQNPKLLYNLGNSYLSDNEYEKAINYFNQSLEQLNPQNKDGQELKYHTYFNLGNSHFYQQHYHQAIENYKKALTINHQDKKLKINFELAIQKLKENKNQSSTQPQKKSSQENASNQFKDNKNPKNSKNNQLKNSNQNKDLKQKSFSKKNAQAILEAFENRQQDSLIKKRYKQNRSSEKLRKNW